MDTRVQIVAIVVSGALLLGVLELVRRRRFLERYALLWLFSALALLVLSAWKGLLGTISSAIGVAYAPSALFVIAFGFILVLLLHFSLVVSRLADQNKVLAQRLALLEERQKEQQEQVSSAAVAASRREQDSERSRVFERARSN
jgi:hypothetical protein